MQHHKRSRYRREDVDINPNGQKYLTFGAPDLVVLRPRYPPIFKYNASFVIVSLLAYSHAL